MQGRRGKIQNTSDKPVKIIDIDFCQFENSSKGSRFQLVMIGNNSAHFPFSRHFRKPHMASRSPGNRKTEFIA